MRLYSDKIALIKNNRGVYSLDTIMGCKYSKVNDGKGCYYNCYATNYAKRYGYDFNTIVKRKFINDLHRNKIVNKISNLKTEFIRIGTSGEPSYDWNHTLNIVDKIKYCNKEIVIITKHFTNISDRDYKIILNNNICVNTSISALDSLNEIKYRLEKYHILKDYCKSVLRIVTCKFNLNNDAGKKYNEIQNYLLDNKDVIETVLRVDINNPYIKNNIIIGVKEIFLKSYQIISNVNNAYIGTCNGCNDKCGINANNKSNVNRIKLVRQSQIFDFDSNELS